MRAFSPKNGAIDERGLLASAASTTLHHVHSPCTFLRVPSAFNAGVFCLPTLYIAFITSAPALYLSCSYSIVSFSSWHASIHLGGLQASSRGSENSKYTQTRYISRSRDFFTRKFFVIFLISRRLLCEQLVLAGFSISRWLVELSSGALGIRAPTRSGISYAFVSVFWGNGRV